MFYFCLYFLGGVNWKPGMFAKATAFLFSSLCFLRPVQWLRALLSSLVSWLLLSAGALACCPLCAALACCQTSKGRLKADFGPAVLQLPVSRSLASEVPVASDSLNSCLCPPDPTTGLREGSLPRPREVRVSSGSILG